MIDPPGHRATFRRHHALLSVLFLVEPLERANVPELVITQTVDECF